jgi:hypothetical protein
VRIKKDARKTDALKKASFEKLPGSVAAPGNTWCMYEDKKLVFQ